MDLFCILKYDGIIDLKTTFWSFFKNTYSAFDEDWL